MYSTLTDDFLSLEMYTVDLYLSMGCCSVCKTSSTFPLMRSVSDMSESGMDAETCIGSLDEKLSEERFTCVDGRHMESKKCSMLHDLAQDHPCPTSPRLSPIRHTMCMHFVVPRLQSDKYFIGD